MRVASLLWLACCACACAGCGAADEPAAGPACASCATPDGAADATDAASDVASGPSPWATSVVSFTPGSDAGFGQSTMPSVVLGPPEGAGRCQGSLDVVALGDGGEIVLAMGQTIVDAPGVDFVVFENAFVAGCGADDALAFAEPAEVAVSEDGVAFTAFPCTATAYPFGQCAGWHPVLAEGAASAPLDPATSGGDPFDLADLGLARARYVRIRDVRSGRGAAPSAGFDLDAIGVVHGG